MQMIPCRLHRRLLLAAITMGTVVVGCDSDQRAVEISRESLKRQAEQNHEMARQNQAVTATTQQLIRTIHLAIEKDRRFPDIEGCVPAPTATKSRLRLSEADARFLERSLSRLSCSLDANGTVTIDLNGSVAVRARSAECAAPTELVLTGSSRSGDQICVATDRRFLERAVQPGPRPRDERRVRRPRHARKGGDHPRGRRASSPQLSQRRQLGLWIIQIAGRQPVDAHEHDVLHDMSNVGGPHRRVGRQHKGENEESGGPQRCRRHWGD
jgi:hypothetical protein